MTKPFLKLFTLIIIACFSVSQHVEGQTQVVSVKNRAQIQSGGSIKVTDLKTAKESTNPDDYNVISRQTIVRLIYENASEQYGSNDWRYIVTLTRGAYTVTLEINNDLENGRFEDFETFRNYGTEEELQITNVQAFSSSQAIADPANSSLLPDDINLELIIETNRIQDLKGASVGNLYFDKTNWQATWSSVPGATEYELEWIFIHEGATPSVLNTVQAFDLKEPVNIKLNNLYYNIDKKYSNGNLYIRVRPVGKDLNDVKQPVYGAPTTIAIPVSGADTDKTRQYVTSFAEDGKHKTVLSYFDGSQRNRQKLTQLSTDDLTIVAETKYDHEGRPAVSILPTVLQGKQLNYHSGINKNTAGAAFEKENFDVSTPQPLNTGSGAGKYYSDNNNSGSIHSEYIPDAEGYAYTQTQYMRDNSGRVTKTSGAGATLGSAGDRQTMYYYGTPSSTELHRLFGSNVGDANHYKKNLVIDPNKQISVSYLDQEGRTIATALAGDAPAGLVGLEYRHGKLITVNLAGNNRIDSENYNSRAINTIMNDQVNKTYKFNYLLDNDASKNLLSYDLRVTIQDEEGNIVPITYNGNTSDNLILNNNAANADPVFTVVLPEIGTYTVTKFLKLNLEEAKTRIGQQIETVYTETYEQDFIDQYITDNTDPDYCNNPNGDLTEQDINDLIDGYTEENCEQYRQMFMREVSPKGIYFEEDLTGTFWTKVQSLLDDNTISATYEEAGTINISSASQFKNKKWQPEWAEQLVLAHREYCHYEECAAAVPSEQYNHKLRRISLWNDAKEGSECYLNPQGMSGITIDGFTLPTGGDNDDYINSALQAEMLNYYVDVNGITYNIWEFVENYHNLDPALITNTGEMAEEYSRISNMSGSEKQEAKWSMFSRTYIGLKKKYQVNENSGCTYYEDGYFRPEEQSLSNVDSPEEVEGMVNDALLEYETGCGESCAQNVRHWLAQMNERCNLGWDMDLIAQTDIYTKLYDYCANKCDVYNPLGLLDFEGVDISTIVALPPCNAGSCEDFAAQLAREKIFEIQHFLEADWEDDNTLKLSTENVIYNHYKSKCLNNKHYEELTFAEFYNLPGLALPQTMKNALECHFEDDPYEYETHEMANQADWNCLNLLESDFNHDLWERGEIRVTRSDIYDCYADKDYDKIGFNTVGSIITMEHYLGTNTTSSLTENIMWIYDADAILNSDETNPSELIPIEPYDLSTITQLYFDTYPTIMTAGEISDLGLPLEYATHTTATVTLDDGSTDVVYIVMPDFIYWPAAVSIPIASECSSFSSDPHDTRSPEEILLEECLARQGRELGYWARHEFQNLINEERLRLYTTVIQDAFNGSFTEDFSCSYENAEYHYTLYYYDQAGNLVQTIPPKGVDVAKARFDDYGNYDNTSPEPAHQMPTKYRYNTLNQLTWQQTPDAGESRFWYNSARQLRFSQNAKQLAEGTASYTHYDELGRIVEVGQTTQDLTTCLNSIDLNDQYGISFYPSTGNSQITRTIYDDPGSLGTGIPAQENLRNRVSYSTYDSDGDGTYEHASYYSYDIHGNVKLLVQHFPELPSDNQYKLIEYEYDLLSGNVNKVTYQKNKADQFIHKYSYDADNRLSEVYTSRNGISWDKDARYLYYAHGPLGRLEIGEDRVQAIDYAYTIQGWLKGVNSDALNPEYDMGKDGGVNAANLNGGFARDAFGFSLGYFDGDYNAKSTDFMASNARATTGAASLYNGNISYMATSNTKVDGARQNMLNKYSYDQLHRIKTSRVFQKTFAGTDNSWSGAMDNSHYATTYGYDKNGNFHALTRQGDKDGYQAMMDNLQYTYIPQTNKLIWVVESQADNSRYSNDYDKDVEANYTRDTPESWNYNYDEIGNLIKDDLEDIPEGGIEWNVYGKISSITRTSGSDKSDLYFTYDAQGNRISKEVSTPGVSETTTTYYVRDATGNIMATYDMVANSGTINTFTLKEQPIYGSSRLGVINLLDDVLNGSTLATGNEYGGFTGERLVGDKSYELSNHLGNVLNVISDKKNVIDENGDGLANYYEPTILSTSNYYPFGMQMPGACDFAGEYRFGFQGQETDQETSLVNYKFRMHDPRIAKFLSVDPLTSSYPYQTPYSYAANSPIYLIDWMGLCPDKPDCDCGNTQKDQYYIEFNPSFGPQLGLTGKLFGIGGSLNAQAANAERDFKIGIEQTDDGWDFFVDTEYQNINYTVKYGVPFYSQKYSNEYGATEHPVFAKEIDKTTKGLTETAIVETKDEIITQESDFKFEPISMEVRVLIVGFEFNVGGQSFDKTTSKDKSEQEEIPPAKEYESTMDPTGDGSWIRMR